MEPSRPRDNRSSSRPRRFDGKSLAEMAAAAFPCIERERVMASEMVSRCLRSMSGIASRDCIRGGRERRLAGRSQKRAELLEKAWVISHQVRRRCRTRNLHHRLHSCWMTWGLRRSVRRLNHTHTTAPERGFLNLRVVQAWTRDFPFANLRHVPARLPENRRSEKGVAGKAGWRVESRRALAPRRKSPGNARHLRVTG